MTIASETPALTVGDYVRIARRRAGMEQAELAREIGAARNTMSNWETGRSEPSFSAIVKIADATGVAVEWFVQGVDTTKAPANTGAIDGECATRDSNPQPSDP